MRLRGELRERKAYTEVHPALAAAGVTQPRMHALIEGMDGGAVVVVFWATTERMRSEKAKRDLENMVDDEVVVCILRWKSFHWSRIQFAF